MSNYRYKMVSTSQKTSKIEDIELWISENGLTRKVIRAEVIENPKVKENSVKIAIVHQRRSPKSQTWQDLGGKTLSDLKAGEAAKIQLDTLQTKNLIRHLSNLYSIGEGGIRKGITILEITDEDRVIKTDVSRARIIKKLLAGNYSNEIWEALVEQEPDLIKKINLSRVYKDREKSLKEFEDNIKLDKDENFWRDFLKRNKWVFGSSYINIIDERRINMSNETDLPFEVDGGFMDIVEIKKPSSNFWTLTRSGRNYLYRGKFLVINPELQGAISQLSGYILQAEKKVDSKEFISSHKGIVPLKPRGLIVHGRSENWKEEELCALRLLNDELHNIQVITFDHLLQRAKRILEIMEKEKK